MWIDGVATVLPANHNANENDFQIYLCLCGQKMDSLREWAHRGW